MLKYKYFLLVILVCLISIKTIIAQSQESIFQLASFPAVSGTERPLLEQIKQQMPSWAESKFDNLDNLIVTIGKGSSNRLIVVPVDEFGYVISEIREDGYLRLQYVQAVAPTPLFHQFYEGQPIIIHTEKKPIAGVTTVLSTHLQRTRVDKSNRICQPDDLWVDIGAKSRQDVLNAGIKLLDPISLQHRATRLGQYQVAGLSAGLRASVASVISLAQNLSPDKIEGTLTIAFVTQEVFGRKGIDRIARSVNANETILITDGWTATHLSATAEKPQLSPVGQVGDLGQGAIVVESDQFWANQPQIQKVPEMKTRRAIYTEGPVLEGNKVHLVALPTLYSSSTVETVDVRDAKALTQMLISKVAKQKVSIEDKENVLVLPKVDTISLQNTENNNVVLPLLVESYGVSTYEKAVREKIKSLLPSWAKPTVDQRGNLVLTVGSGKPHIVFAAHMDEIGYKITSINEDGTAKVEKLGGFYDTLFEAHTMLTHINHQKSIASILTPRQNYFRVDTRNPNTADLLLYFGTKTKAETENLGVKVGCSVTMPKEFNPLLNNRASGRSFDDRVGSASLILALRQLDPSKVKSQVTFVWTVEEETGLDGAQDFAARYKEDVDYIFAIDTFVSSDSPVEITRFAYAPIGKGAVIRALDNSNIVPRQFVNKILALATENNIAIQYGVTGGGNDGAVFTQYGTVDIPLSWPLRYSHSPAEVIDLQDLESLAKLVKVLTEQGLR